MYSNILQWSIMAVYETEDFMCSRRNVYKFDFPEG